MFILIINSMKIVICLYFTCLSYLLAQPSIVWEKKFDTEHSSEIGWEIVAVPEGFAIVGTTGPDHFKPGKNWRGLILKISPKGELLDKRVLESKGNSFLTSIIFEKGHYFAVGSKYQFPNALQAWIIKMDQNFRIIKERTIGGSKNDSAKQIVSLGEGNFFIIGQTHSYGKGDKKSDVWLIKMDENGAVLWERTYDLGGEDMGTSIAKLTENRFLISVTTCTARCGSLLQEGFASYILIDGDGRVIKERKFTQGKKNKFLKVKSTGDGGAILVGVTSAKEKFPSEDIWVVKLDSQAEVQWSEVINSKNRYDGASDIVELTNGGYIIVGYSQVHQSKEMNYDNFLLLKLDNEGNIVWSREWGGKDNDDLFAVIKIPGDSIVVVGSEGGVSWPLNEVPGDSAIYVSEWKVE